MCGKLQGPSANGASLDRFYDVTKLYLSEQTPQYENETKGIGIKKAFKLALATRQLLVKCYDNKMVKSPG